jgi:lysophospholipase L1-like esterase
MSLTTLRTKRGILALAATAALAGSLMSTLPASAASSPQKPVFQGARYLALGDSVPFGFREASTLPTPDYNKPKSFSGFPELVARDLGLRLTNASCPGETTSSMINKKAQSNGCLTRPDGSPGYRAAFPLHVKYSGSQLDFAAHWLGTHPNTRLVTLMIGANDGFLCQETTPDHCTSPQELGAVLATVSKNVKTILQRLRQGAHYAGQIVVVSYYSLDYADPNQTALSLALDQAIAASAQKYNATMANGFGIFKRAAAQASGNTCAAGLLTILNGQSTPCGVHPSLAGQALLSSAVERKVKKS